MSRNLSVAVIGAGWASELHLQAYAATPETQVTAICSRTRERAEEVAERFSVPSVYTDFTELLERERPDIVSIATPPDSHSEYTLSAVAHGCNVLCDKPVALAASDCKTMLEAAETAGVRHASGFIWRFDPAMLKLRELIGQEAVGTVREIHCRCALGAPVLPWTWMYDRTAGGGSLMQHGTHIIDRVRWISGQEFVGVTGEVTYDVKEALVGPQFHNVFDAFQWGARRAAMGGDPLPTREVTADTGYAFSGRLGNDVRVSLWEAMHSTGAVADQLEIYGTRGTLIWSAVTGLTCVRPGRNAQAEPIEVEGTSAAGGGDLRGAEEAGHRYWGVLAQAFAQDILGLPHGPYPTLLDGWRVQQVVDGVLASTESRSWEAPA